MSASIDLRGKRALVCGASAGIGRATALALAEAGADMVVLARTAPALEELCAQLRELGAPQAESLVADMDDREALGERVASRLASGPMHILVHNTGGPPSGPILEKGEEDILAVVGRHLLTAHQLTRLLLPGMIASGYGRIVNVLSMSAREPIANLGLSNVVRAGLVGWAKTVSQELPPGLTINNVLPGYTDTERLAELRTALARRAEVEESQVESGWVADIPEARLGRPEEIAAAILFLVSPMASYVRGQSLAVDGGRMRGL